AWPHRYLTLISLFDNTTCNAIFIYRYGRAAQSGNPGWHRPWIRTRARNDDAAHMGRRERNSHLAQGAPIRGGPDGLLGGQVEFAPDGQGSLGVIQGIEMQAGRAVVEQRLAQLAHHIDAKGADGRLVV